MTRLHDPLEALARWLWERDAREHSDYRSWDGAMEDHADYREYARDAFERTGLAAEREGLGAENKRLRERAIEGIRSIAYAGFDSERMRIANETIASLAAGPAPTGEPTAWGEVSEDEVWRHRKR